MKDRILGILAFLWMRLLPILLVCGFFVGVHFFLWKDQGLTFGLSLLISVLLGGATLYGFGKLIKLW